MSLRTLFVLLRGSYALRKRTKRHTIAKLFGFRFVLRARGKRLSTLCCVEAIWVNISPASPKTIDTSHEIVLNTSFVKATNCQITTFEVAFPQAFKRKVP